VPPCGRAFYMSAVGLARMKTTPLGSSYAHLRAAGKPAKVALTAVMRKLLLQMNRVLKEHALQPNPLKFPHALETPLLPACGERVRERGSYTGELVDSADAKRGPPSPRPSRGGEGGLAAVVVAVPRCSLGGEGSVPNCNSTGCGKLTPCSGEQDVFLRGKTMKRFSGISASAF